MKSITRIAYKGMLLSIFMLSMISLYGYFQKYNLGGKNNHIEIVAAQNAAPSILSLSPSSCYMGEPGFMLTVNGTNFLEGSVVKWNTSSLSTQYTSPTQVKATIPASYLAAPGQVAITVENPPPDSETSNTVQFTILRKEHIFLPLSVRNWPPQATKPLLEPIDNADQDNHYTIKWGNPTAGGTYILEEAWDSAFTNAGVVYQGSALTWTVPTEGKLPRTYYYRVKAKNAYNESTWSETQSITIYPLYVGLKVRWDGKGYLYVLGDYDEPGTHETVHCDALTDSDTIRCKFSFWYDPNPIGWEAEYWNVYYSVQTGAFKSTDAIEDPIVKWGYSWKLAYGSWFNNGDTVHIGGEEFTVTGPIAGYTIYGQSISYWEFVNQETFTVQDDGEGITSSVHPGDVVLRYDAGSSALLIYDSVKRSFYYEGEYLGYAHYISNLTAASSLPGSPPVLLTNQVYSALQPPPTHLEGVENLVDGIKLVKPGD